MWKEAQKTVTQFLISHPTKYKYCFDAWRNNLTEEQKEKYISWSTHFLLAPCFLFTGLGTAQGVMAWTAQFWALWAPINEEYFQDICIGVALHSANVSYTPGYLS